LRRNEPIDDLLDSLLDIRRLAMDRDLGDSWEVDHGKLNHLARKDGQRYSFVSHALLVSRDLVSLCYNFVPHFVEICEFGPRSVEKFRVVFLFVGGQSAELEDQGAAGHYSRASGQEVFAHDALQDRGLAS